MTIPHSRPSWGEDEIAALVEGARSLRLDCGPVASELEREIASDLGYSGAAATVTGSHALHLALRAKFQGRPVRVGCPTYLCRSVYDAVVAAGCTPVLLDIDPHTFSASLRHALASELDAIVLAHLFGIRAGVDAFLAHGLFVIEDCAQRLAPPRVARDEPRAPVRILSLGATKIITAGEGGLLLADDVDLLDRVRALRDAPYTYHAPAIGGGLPDLLAAVALRQWRRLPVLLTRRRQLAAIYMDRLNCVPALREPDTYPFRFVLRVSQADAFIEKAARGGVVVRKPVAPMCLHTLFGVAGRFPASDDALAHVVSLPFYPALTDEEARHVIAVASAA